MIKFQKHLVIIVVTGLLGLNIALIGTIWLGSERVFTALKSRAANYLGIEVGESVDIPVNIVLGHDLTDDPLSAYQWGLRMLLDGADYWSIQKDAPRDVVVALIDRGVHMDHEDLLDKLALGGGYNFISDSSIMNTIDDKKPPNSSITHGQCSASIIAAKPDNGIGMAGVFHRAFIMPLQSDGHLSQAINYAIDNQADVILFAGGSGKDTQWIFPMYQNRSGLPAKYLYSDKSLKEMRAIKSSLDRAYSANIPVIVGVGNNRSFDLALFSDYHGTISVGPHNIFGQISEHTSFSYTFDVFAPGGSRLNIENKFSLNKKFPKDLRIVSPNADFDDPICAVGENSYSFLTLGSAAMPHVAGSVAMIKSFLPEATVEDIRQMLKDSTIPLEPSGSLLEGLGGRLSLRLLRENIDKRLP